MARNPGFQARFRVFDLAILPTNEEMTDLVETTAPGFPRRGSVSRR